MKESWQFWVDRGGTFTDIIGISSEGKRVTSKLLSENNLRYQDSILEGIRRVLGIPKNSPLPSGRIESVKIGTTVSTNALLQRRGEPTLLCITRGFGDALKIGYQDRPSLFDLRIKRPAPLYKMVYEVDERIRKNGHVVKAPDLKEVKAKLLNYFELGIRSVAILLMHGWRFNLHELLLKKIAIETGFHQIAVSSEVSPVIGLIPRGDTTVVDAYLSPVLKRYTDTLSGKLSRTRLMFMQSGGGLVSGAQFCGKNSILSGPAGGVAGIVKSSAGEGIKRIIGFDMGGTSTDVSHYNGSVEHCTEKIVDGIRVRAPAIKINTVASGGGSMLFFDGMRYRVGPESAGSDPGPCSYGKGGPLAVTDANLVVGKIIPECFPKVFGPEGNHPLNRDLVISKMDTLLREIEVKTGEPHTPEIIGEGFIKIANQKMALAIKEVSVSKGYDVTKYTLGCFGGAGGQHACNVADLLGMKKVYIPPYAGILSALGIGLSDLQASAEKSVETSLTQGSFAGIISEFKSLEESVLKNLLEQGGVTEDIVITKKVDIRYEGTNTPFSLEFTSSEELKEEFEKKHRQYFGFIMKEKGLVAETVRVEAVYASGVGELLLPPVEDGNSDAAACFDTKMFSGGRWHNCPVYNRSTLGAGFSASGPAIILEDSSTTVVEPGWTASVSAKGGLFLTRDEPERAKSLKSVKCDPVMLEIFNNIFSSVADQMGQVLERTATSTNIKERRDFSCAVFDSEGGLIANAPHIPVHLGALGASVKSVIQEKGMLLLEGDVIITNDPFNGGSHLPDITVVSPLFDSTGKKILFFVANRGHHADIGGVSPGSMPSSSRDIHEEGVLLKNLFLVKKGVFQEVEILKVLGSGKNPVRNAGQNISDLRAQVAANKRGLDELAAVIYEYGLETVKAYTRFIMLNAEEAVRNVISGLDPGEFADFMDNGEKIRVRISVDRKKRGAKIDFSGTSKQDPGNMNAPIAVTYAAVIYVFRTLVNENIPLNSGFLVPLEIVVPEGSMLNPVYPAAVAGGNVEVSMRVVDVLYGALETMGAGQGTMNNFTFGNKSFQYYETIGGGSGAGEGFDGESGVHTHMTNTRITDPELLEWKYPVILNEFSIRRESGGRGRYHGGDGLRREVEFLDEIEAGGLTERRETMPYGMAGGGCGLSGKNILIKKSGERIDLGGRFSLKVSSGDSILIETPGGGGFGREEL